MVLGKRFYILIVSEKVLKNVFILIASQYSLLPVTSGFVLVSVCRSAVLKIRFFSVGKRPSLKLQTRLAIERISFFPTIIDNQTEKEHFGGI
jgi:hypothetical protein